MCLVYLQKLKEQEKNVTPLIKQSNTPQAKPYPTRPSKKNPVYHLSDKPHIQTKQTEERKHKKTQYCKYLTVIAVLCIVPIVLEITTLSTHS